VMKGQNKENIKFQKHDGNPNKENEKFSSSAFTSADVDKKSRPGKENTKLPSAASKPDTTTGMDSRKLRESRVLRKHIINR